MIDHPFQSIIKSGYVHVTLKVKDPETALGSLSEQFVQAKENHEPITFHGFEFFNVRVGDAERGKAFTDELMQLIRKHGL